MKASAKFEKDWYDKYWKNVNLEDYKNEDTIRQLYFLKELGSAVLPTDRLAFVSFWAASELSFDMDFIDWFATSFNCS